MEVFVSDPGFDEMTKIDLRAYVIAHPNDREAFQAFIDRVTSEASINTFDVPRTSAEVEEVDFLIRQKLEDRFRLHNPPG